MRRCDIIIPVYNAFDCLKPCIESVLKNTDFSIARLIIIDDKSPDERVLPLLTEFYKKNPKKIILIKNKTNLGFVKTVNKGMKQSDNDVILLNSDTIVPKRWMKKMMECGLRHKSIATVTPLSNNMTPINLPDSFRKHGFPNNYTFEQMAELVENVSLRQYPEVPSSHGFCMYIKREVLDRVGFFDEELFGRGYGEENDFCFRCFKYGYHHVLCDDTFVLHKGTQSFLDEREMHNDILMKKYPIIMNRIDTWFQRRDLGIIIDNIVLSLESREKRVNILILVRDKNRLFELASTLKKLKSEHNYFVLYPEKNNYSMYYFGKYADFEVAMFEKRMVVNSVVFYSEQYSTIYQSIIIDYGISVVIIDELLGHYLNIIEECNKEKIKLVVGVKNTIKEYDEESRFWQSECAKKIKEATRLKNDINEDGFKQELRCICEKCSRDKKMNEKTIRERLFICRSIRNIELDNSEAINNIEKDPISLFRKMKSYFIKVRGNTDT